MRFLLAGLIASAAILAAPQWALAQEEPATEGATAEHHAGGHHDPGHGNAGAGLESMTEVRTDLAVYTFAVFLVLLAILSFTAWPKISKALLEREKRIEANIAAAEAKHEEAKRLLAEHEARLATAAGEVRALMEEARRDAEATRE